MKLVSRILIRLALVLTVVLAVWTFLFYSVVIKEVNEGTDDALDDYAELIMIGILSGEELPSRNSGSGRQYFIRPVESAEAMSREKISFSDDFVYVPEKGEKEPVRVLTTLFKDGKGTYYELKVSMPTIEKEDLQEAIFRWVIVLYGVLLFFLTLICSGVFYRSLKPLYVLLRWLEEFHIGETNKPLVNPTRITEFSRLNRAARESARRSEALFKQQQQFIGNASHEMQTPLAVCMNRLELLMEDGELTHGQQQELVRTYRTLENLSRLNKSLLLLAKIENGQFTATAGLELNSLVRQYAEDYKDIYRTLQLRVELEERAVFGIKMNGELASVLCADIIKNAFVHNRENGSIRIEITASRILVRNTGPEMPLDAARIFSRFYRDTKKEGSTGLGLALAEAVCKLQPLNIRYYFDKGEHCFEIYRKNK